MLRRVFTIKLTSLDVRQHSPHQKAVTDTTPAQL